MLTLIIREIEDNRVFFIAAIFLTAIFGVLFVYQHFYYDQGNEDILIGFGAWFSFPLGMAFFAMGAAQMYGDRTKKISALLSTLAVNRGQIFTARIITGILFVIIGLIPIAGAIITAVSYKKFIGPTPSGMPVGLYYEILIPVILLGFACYCLGLQAGWTTSKVRPSIGAIGLCAILIPVILIKSFSWEIYAILIALILASLIRAWHKYSTAAL